MSPSRAGNGSLLRVLLEVVMDFDFWYYVVHVTQEKVSYIHETQDIRLVTKDLKLAYDLYNILIEQDPDSRYALVRQNKAVSRLMCVLDTLRDTARPRINNKDLFKYR